MRLALSRKKGKSTNQNVPEEECLSSPKLIKQALEQRWWGLRLPTLERLARAMIHGSNHPRTARSAIGQH